MGISRLYRRPGIAPAKADSLRASANAAFALAGSATRLAAIDAELCFYIEFPGTTLLNELAPERTLLQRLVRESSGSMRLKIADT
jgi:hypothetical protein